MIPDVFKRYIQRERNETHWKMAFVCEGGMYTSALQCKADRQFAMTEVKERLNFQKITFK